MDATHHNDASRDNSSLFPAGWYPDPWRIAPFRWYDGEQWTPGLFGPYGEAWPLSRVTQLPVQSKGPGIKGGGIAAVGAGVGVFGSLVISVVYLIARGIHGIQARDPWYVLFNAFALWFGLVGAVIVASRINGTRNLARDFGLAWPSKKDLGAGILIGLVGRLWAVLLMILIALASHEGLGSTHRTAPRLLGVTPRDGTGWSILIFLTVFAAPFVEELFFRGLVQGAFTRRVGDVPAILITALLFVAAHVASEGPLAPVALFPMALLLGYLRHKTGRLGAGMIAHAIFNATIFVLFLVPVFR